MVIEHRQDCDEGAWNPGIKSNLPSEYLPLSTIFRSENVLTSIEVATELKDFSGLKLTEVVRFRPERLIIHELLICVSADIFISDGSKYQDLGFNFRKAARTIHQDYITPNETVILKKFSEFEQQVKSAINAELSTTLFKPAETSVKPDEKFDFFGLFKSKRKKKKSQPQESIETRNRRMLDTWAKNSESKDEPLARAIFCALFKVGNAINVKHGRLIGDKSLLSSLATGLVCNDYGSELIGEIIAPYIQAAAIKEGYRILPIQPDPILINVKGSSAAGKSTIRPLQHKHTEKLGLAWQDFALISPDIWRKYLLDYDSLGVAYKYAGMLTGDEIPILDRKFDRYIDRKSKRGGLSHMLIDRFRFNTFAHGLGPDKGSNLLTRFGHTVYLVFMVTPPEATVERAWKRGLQVGRFKSVDDLLDHNIEAFNGIPDLFFTWSLHKSKTVYYEFLDNSVAYGEKPRVIAFGKNSDMYILDFKCMFDIVRYTKINIEAKNPAEVYPDPSQMESVKNAMFLQQCAQNIPRIYFVDPESKQIYAYMESAKMSWIDPVVMKHMLSEQETKTGFLAIAPKLIDELAEIKHQPAKPLSTELTLYIMGAIN
jgi:hypothetical protein